MGTASPASPVSMRAEAAEESSRGVSNTSFVGRGELVVGLGDEGRFASSSVECHLLPEPSGSLRRLVERLVALGQETEQVGIVPILGRCDFELAYGPLVVTLFDVLHGRREPRMLVEQVCLLIDGGGDVVLFDAGQLQKAGHDGSETEATDVRPEGDRRRSCEGEGEGVEELPREPEHEHDPRGGEEGADEREQEPVEESNPSIVAADEENTHERRDRARCADEVSQALRLKCSVRERRTHPAGDIDRCVEGPAPDVLDAAATEPQQVHVPQEVHEARVQKEGAYEPRRLRLSRDVSEAAEDVVEVGLLPTGCELIELGLSRTAQTVLLEDPWIRHDVLLKLEVNRVSALIVALGQGRRDEKDHDVEGDDRDRHSWQTLERHPLVVQGNNHGDRRRAKGEAFSQYTD